MKQIEVFDMSAAQVLHFGDDTAYRSTILRTVGYEVVECGSDAELVRWFQSGRKADIVCISESRERACEAPLAIVKKYSQAPVVLFRTENPNFLQHSCDLEVQPLTPPDAWLREFAQLLVLTRRNIAESTKLQARARQLCEETARVREQSVKSRAKIQRGRDEGKT